MRSKDSNARTTSPRCRNGCSSADLAPLSIRSGTNQVPNIRRHLKWRSGTRAGDFPGSEGRSKKEAEQAAARLALEILEAGTGIG